MKNLYLIPVIILVLSGCDPQSGADKKTDKTTASSTNPPVSQFDTANSEPDCDDACQEVKDKRADAEACEPQLIAVAPDGTNLWKVQQQCSKVSDDVYFSSHGTQTSNSGRHTYKEEFVPSGE